MDCLETASAWRLLHDPQAAGTLDMEGFLELAKAAGYGERAAQEAARQRGLERLRKDLPA